MGNWYILFGIVLSWSIPWTIMQLTDGMFILEQAFRILYWGSFVLSYELVELHWGICLIIAHIPGAIFWACYDHWFDDNTDTKHTISGSSISGMLIKN